MCEFLSYIEKGDKIYYLTYDLIHNTPRGEMIQKRFPGTDELIGHVPIRAYFEIENGIEKECTDFSTPANFPEPIVKALKNREFIGFPFSKGLLKKTLDKKYTADRKILDEKYTADLKILDENYWADHKPLDEKYTADRKTLDDKYWNLFINPVNRAKAWR